MKKEQEINGVLYLPALGLLTTCVVGTFNYYKIFRLFHSKFIHDEPIAIWFAAYILVGGFLYLIWSYYSTFLFFYQSRRTKKAMVIYYLFGFLLYTPLFLAIHFFREVPLDIRMQGAITSGLIGVFVWIPYFLKSKRIPLVFFK